MDVSLGLAGGIMGGKGKGQKVLEVLGEKIGFEIAAGRNGRVWVKGDGVGGTMVVRRVVEGLERVEEGGERRCVDGIVKDVLG